MLSLHRDYQGTGHQTLRTLLLKSLSLSISVALLANTAYAAPTVGQQGVKQSSQSPDLNTSQQDTPSTSVPAVSGNVRFACQSMNGQYTVMYYPESQPNQSYPWAVPSQMGGGWTSDRRCAEISRRLESYRPDGLEELRTGVENGYNVICATTQQNPACRIVLTVPPGQDPVLTRDRVFENLSVADSGQQTEGVAAFNDNEVDDLLNRLGDVLNPERRRQEGIDLRPFLDRADGGTGEQLQGGVSTPSAPTRLNPDRFR